MPWGTPQVAVDRDSGDGGFGLVLALGVAREMGWFRTETSKCVWTVHTAPRPRPVVRDPSGQTVT